MENRKLLGVLGGLGPMSSVYFYELVTENTKASKDQDHLDIVISSRATTPDRTDYILGNSKTAPHFLWHAKMRLAKTLTP